MLSDSKLPVIFWAKAVNTACSVLNRVLTVKRKNKTCYELLHNSKPNLERFDPFGVMCTLLKNEKQSKFGEKADEGFFLGYVPASPNKRVYNLTTRRVEIVTMLKSSVMIHLRRLVDLLGVMIMMLYLILLIFQMMFHVTKILEKKRLLMKMS